MTTTVPTEFTRPLPDAAWARSDVSDDETVLIASHPSLAGHVVGYVGGALGTVAGFAVVVAAFLGVLPGGLLAVGLGVAALAFLTAVWTHLRRITTWYVVTDRQVLVKRGVLDADTDPVDHGSVREVEVDRPFYLRPFRVGNVRVFAASTDGPDLLLSHTPEVGSFASELTRCRRANRRS